MMEVVVLIVVLGITATMLTPIVTSLVKGPESERRIEAAILAQQQCAERMLAARNGVGYAALSANACASLPVVDGIKATATIVDTTGGACATGLSCKKITVEAVDNASGAKLGINSITLMVANY